MICSVWTLGVLGAAVKAGVSPSTPLILQFMVTAAASQEDAGSDTGDDSGSIITEDSEEEEEEDTARNAGDASAGAPPPTDFSNLASRFPVAEGSWKCGLCLSHQQARPRAVHRASRRTPVYLLLLHLQAQCQPLPLLPRCRLCLVRLPLRLARLLLPRFRSVSAPFLLWGLSALPLRCPLPRLRRLTLAFQSRTQRPATRRSTSRLGPCAACSAVKHCCSVGCRASCASNVVQFRPACCSLRSGTGRCAV